jgi:hypothetical protein
LALKNQYNFAHRLHRSGFGADAARILDHVKAAMQAVMRFATAPADAVVAT